MSKQVNPSIIIVTTLVCFLSACANSKTITSAIKSESVKTSITVTSEAGDKLAEQFGPEFVSGKYTGITIDLDPNRKRQTITGIGSSFTESSAFVLAHLPIEKRNDVMQAIYSEQGANFSLARTTIGSTDFSVEGKQSYASTPNDVELESFSISMDSDGFAQDRYSQIDDTDFDLLPMIKQAQAIKHSQDDDTLRIVASAWTAPPWMKDIEQWYINPTPENDHQGTGGKLKPEYESTYADYLIKYLLAYQQQGVDLWALTPVNEPHGNSGQWESMHFTPETQNVFIKQQLGPKLHAAGLSDLKLLIYDQNRDDIGRWVDTIMGDPETAPYVYGTAIHWYGSTYKVFEEELEKAHNSFPGFDIIHTEATIDDLGKPAGDGIADKAGFEEENWFNNDAFWWNENASDWAYTASWAPKAEDHPMYTPTHRYARNIIVSLNHWVSGWIDWNVVLDHNGGPNHVGNFCGAPIMIDTNTDSVYYTPIYYILAQFSRSIRPGDQVISSSITGNADKDSLYSLATINQQGLISVQVLNTSKSAQNYAIQIAGQYASISVPANALQTVQFSPN